MKTSESQKNAIKKYKQKVKRLTVDFHPSESDLWEQVSKQPKKQTYIKNLIRKDMERENQYDRLKNARKEDEGK
jgi:hypothetical protein